MKKNFFKKLSFVTAFALVATAVAPAGLVSAATTPNLAKRYATVYEGASRAYAVKDATGYTVKWTVSGEGAEYASLTKTSGAKTALSVDTEGELAAKNANVTVRANFYKDGKLVKSAGDVVTVKVNATALDITTDADVTAVPAGETVDFNRKITPANATSVTYWSVTDKDGKATTDATIDGAGNFTATKLGEYIVVAEAKNAKDGVVKTSDTQAVTVVLDIVSAVQATTDDLTVTFNADMTGAVATDFSIVKDDTKQTIAVKSIAVDGKKVTVTTFAQIEDGKTYTVSYKGTSYQFTATDNKVASLEISPLTIPYATATKVGVTTKDANGVVLDAYDFGSVSDQKLDFTISTTEGYTSGANLVLFEKGDTAEVKATYHTFEYDSAANEIGAITTTVTITAVDPATVSVTDAKYTVAKDPVSDWSKVTTTNTKLAIEDTTNNVLSVYIEKSSADNVNVAGDYSLVSSNNDVLLVSDIGDGTAVLTAVAQGAAYVLVKDTDGNVVYSFAVSIVAKRAASALVLGATSVTVSNSTNVDETKDVTVKQNDQYGDAMATIAAGDITVTALNAPSSLTLTNVTEANGYFTVANGKVTFNGTLFGTTAVTAGTYNYKVQVGSLIKTVQVVVKAPTTSAPIVYQLAVSESKVDVNFDGSSTSDKEITIKVAEVQGGVINNYAGITSYTIKKGSDVVVTGGAIGTEITFTALAVTGSSVTKAATGSYTISVVAGGVTLNGGFVIEDTQSSLTVTREADAVALGTDATVLDAAFDFHYNGEELSSGDYTIVSYTSIPSTAFASGNSYYIKTITVNVDVEGYDVPVTVTVNKTITIN
jgi:hypothetical protein